MLRFLGKRLLMALFTVFAASVISFLLVHATDGSPGAIALGMGALPKDIHDFNASVGWYDPLTTQYLHWAGQLLHGNLGVSILDSHDVAQDLFARLPVTASMACAATLSSAVIGIVLGVVAAVRGGLLDRLISLGSGIAFSLPAFWVGIVIVYFLAVQHSWFPATGYVSIAEGGAGEWLKSLALPVLSLTIGGAAGVARTARAAMVDSIAADHIRTLRAIGTPEWRIRYIHALRSASVQVVAILGMQFVLLFGGSVVAEQVFALPGLGMASSAAAATHDFPVVQPVVLIATTVVVVTNLLIDLAIGFLDPKVRVA
jgi:peptide/nickel transport system permease protein